MADDPEQPPPAMIGTPPSASQVPLDPGLHASDFSKRYAQEIDLAVSGRMIELGIDRKRIGRPDPDEGNEWAAFHPNDRNARGISPEGNITIGSGIFDPTLMDSLGPVAGKAWAASRVTHRLNAAVAHEDMEHRAGTHDAAVENAPDTDLSIGGQSRRLLRTIRMGAQSIRRGDDSPSR